MPKDVLETIKDVLTSSKVFPRCRFVVIFCFINRPHPYLQNVEVGMRSDLFFRYSKNPWKHKVFKGFGAAGQIRTADLILTNSFGSFNPLRCKAFERFLLRKRWGRDLFVPLFPSARFPVWVTVWVKVKTENDEHLSSPICTIAVGQNLHRCNQRIEATTVLLV